MLDDLLGRSALKEQIAQLEAEREELRADVESLESQLEAERERRSEAQRARQEADERINRLEDRIAGLEGDLERAREDDADLTFRGRTDLRGDRLREILDRLDSYRTEPEGALTAMVPEDPPEPLRDRLDDRAALLDRVAPSLVCLDDAGLVAAALDPPVAPDPFEEWADGFRLDREWFLPSGEYALALVRADLFVLGEYRDGERVSTRSHTSDVEEGHSKGGFSQGRFERRRDEQISEHLDRCEELVADREADTLYVVGDGRLIEEFEDAAVTRPVDASGDPDEAIDAAARSFWTTRLFLF